MKSPFRRWFGSRRPSRPMRYQFGPGIVPLESRLTPAVSASLSPAGVLTFTGDAGINVVDARDLTNGDVQVSYGDVTNGALDLTTTTFQGVTKIKADLGAGTDVFR